MVVFPCVTPPSTCSLGNLKYGTLSQHFSQYVFAKHQAFYKNDTKRFIVFHRNSHFALERCDKSQKSIFAKIKNKKTSGANVIISSGANVIMWKKMLSYGQFRAVKILKKFHVYYLGI
jgi:hypothetical protein